MASPGPLRRLRGPGAVGAAAGQSERELQIRGAQGRQTLKVSLHLTLNWRFDEETPHSRLTAIGTTSV